VELGPPTATQIAITTESGDERVTGPVEKYSTAAADVSDALSKVPYFTTLAKASSLVFRGIAGFASWFGWSRPAIPEDPRYVKNRPYSSTALTICNTTAEKIAFDEKQELTVDPRICATDSDEMSIAFLAGVSSYLTTFNWTHEHSLMTPIWSCPVHPQLGVTMTHTAVQYIQPTAMALPTSCFQYWRGKIKFRLEIVCSRFHRGKIGILFEPNINQEVLITSSYTLNKNYTKIIDIQETQDVEFCIEYCQPYVWLRTLANNDALIYGYGSNFTANGDGQVNGFISIYAFTDLQSPDDSDVPINVYVSAEDLQLNQATAKHLATYRTVYTQSLDDKGASPEIGYTCLTLNQSSSNSAGTSTFCFGEQPLSLRSLLKRYATTNIVTGTTSSSTVNLLYINFPIIPLSVPDFAGNNSGGHNTFIQQLMWAYLGVKGGMRKRVRVWFPAKELMSQQQIQIMLGDVLNSIPASSLTVTSAQPYVEDEGEACFLPLTNGGVEVELPFYSSNLFHFAFSLDFGQSEVANGEMCAYWTSTYQVKIPNTTVSLVYRIWEETATAEDFTLMKFTGCPWYSLS